MPIQRAYTDGTVRLTAGSAVVRGTGTAWALRLVNGGLLTFGGRAFPIASVASDTELTLENPSTVTYEGIYAIELHSAEASTALAASRRLADLLDGLNGLSPLGRQLTAADTPAAMRTVLDALGRSDSIPNANLTAMQPGTVKMRRPGAGPGVPVDATIAQLIADLGVPVPLPTFTAIGGETQAIFSIPAGTRGVAFDGSFVGSDSANAQMRARLSFNGGVSYLSAADSYQWQHSFWSGTTSQTAESAGNFMPFAAAADGGAALMTQFAVTLDFFPGRHARFSIKNGAATRSSNRIVTNDGFVRGSGTPTHILIFQEGGPFVAGTQIRAEAR